MGPTTDIAVIGAGIVGSAAAYEALRAGRSVTLLDADHPGRATDAGAGIVNPLDLVGTALAAESHRVELGGPAHYARLMARLAGDGQPDTGYAEAGQIVVARTAEQQAAVEAFAARIPPALTGYFGLPRWVDATEMVPYLPPGTHGLLLPGVARVDGRVFNGALAQALMARGVRRIHGDGKVVLDHGRAVGVDVGGRRIEAARVIVAAGAWPVEGIGPLVRPIRGQIMHLEFPHEGAAPIVSSVGGSYILGFPPDRIVAGATHEDVGFDHRATAGGVHSILSNLLALAPGLAGTQIIETRVGFRPVSADGLPVIGEPPEITGLVVATGLGAHGLTLGPAAGAIAARIAIGEDPGADISAMLPARFSPRT
ncbi:MAG TPA: FAD-dependent oxidoreductase [Mycobacteriales bacterium]|nr:FAD-dependent oxidoreductase [Mycobacteriales bacterium]